MPNSQAEPSQQEAIEATGCSELNERLLLCYDHYKDWRKCHVQLQEFRDCYRRFAGSSDGPRRHDAAIRANR